MNMYLCCRLSITPLMRLASQDGLNLDFVVVIAFTPILRH